MRKLILHCSQSQLISALMGAYYEGTKRISVRTSLMYCISRVNGKIIDGRYTEYRI